MKINSFLKNIFLFSELTETELNNVASVSALKRVRKGQHVFEEGDTATSFYAVAHGAVKVFKINEEGTENILHVQNDGDLIAEAVLFGIKRYPANCAAIKDSTIISIPKEGFVDLILRNPKLSIKFMSAYSRRLKGFVDKIEALSNSVEQRLSVYLIEHSVRSKGRQVCELDISKKDLASLLGTSPETISRTLNRLEKQDKIAIESNKRIIIRQ
jgi:CRP/FNR family transcriptional regulator